MLGVEFEKRLQGDTAVFHLKGVINMTETAFLRGEFWACITGDGVRTLIVDLSGVPTMSSSAVTLLVGAQNMTQNVKGRLILTGLSRTAYRYLEQFNLHHYFTMQPSPPEDLTVMSTTRTAEG